MSLEKESKKNKKRIDSSNFEDENRSWLKKVVLKAKYNACNLELKLEEQRVKRNIKH